MSANFTPKNAENYVCKNCDFICSKKSDWSRHVLTLKHKNRTKLNILEQKKSQYKCTYCNKTYNARNSLWYHEKKCKDTTSDKTKINIETDDKNIIGLLIKETNDFKNVVLELVKSNNLTQTQILDVCKNNSGQVTNNTINSNNKSFNLNFFLNEQCKDAMNLMDFVNTFQLQFSDLERIGEVGYVEGISHLIIDKLNEMDIYKRPIHCSDAKREIMYVKENDVWEKENANNDKLRLAIKHITKKNTDMIRPWINKHPGILNSEHRLNDKYQEIIIEAMGGKNNQTMKEGENKIIKKISKMVLIDKCYNGLDA